MRKLIQKFETYVHRTFLNIKQMEAEIENLKVEEETSTRRVHSRLSKEIRLAKEEQLRKECKKYKILCAVNEVKSFTENLIASFSHKWVPVVALLLILMGPFDSILSFLFSTLINVVIFIALLSVLMYAMGERWIPEVHWEDKNSNAVKYSKGIFLLLAVGKFFFGFFGTGAMYIAVAIIAVAVALYIVKDDIKTLIERWKNK